MTEADGEIVGYTLGSRHPLKYNLLFYPFIACPLFFVAFLKCLTKAYDEKIRAYIKKLVLNGSRERPKRPKKAAHFHLNIKEGYRRRGVGKALARTLFRHFLEKGVGQVFGELLYGLAS